MSVAIQIGLEEYYRRSGKPGEGLEVRNLQNVTGGWENEVYAFDLLRLEGESSRSESLILRIYPGDYAELKSLREFEGMRKLHRAGYPVPHVHLREALESPFGRPFIIMDRIEGRLLYALIKELPEVARAKLRTQFFRLFVDLHRLDWRPFEEDAESFDEQAPYAFVDKYLVDEREVLEESGLVGFLPVLSWLEERRDNVPCETPAVMHGDFHMSNVLVRKDGSMVVLDWTGCQVSDPRLDLALALVLIRAYGTEERRRFYVREYERLAGAQIANIEWFEVLACLWRLRAIAMALAHGPGKLGWRPDVGSTILQSKMIIRNIYDFIHGTNKCPGTGSRGFSRIRARGGCRALTLCYPAFSIGLTNACSRRSTAAESWRYRARYSHTDAGVECC